MTIKRYFPIADNTISNAFDKTLLLANNASGSNMGAADILEIFQIYGQSSSSSGLSSELSRVLLQFDTDAINSDRTDKKIPVSGKVSFYLKMCNARHTETLPENYDLLVSAVSGTWEEGYGLDMVNYTDKTYELSGSSWSFSGHRQKATATIVISDSGGIIGGETFTLVDSVGLSTVYTINSGIAPASGGGSDGSANVGFQGVGGGSAGKVAAASAIAIAINATTDANYTASSNGVDTVTITQGTVGVVGNKANGDSISSTTVSDFAGGQGPWLTAGGDYYDSPTFTQNFKEGYEDLEVNVTSLVEQWLDGTKVNDGFGIRLTDAFEQRTTSYYTKKFFSRSTEFYFKRPVLEARWDDTVQDDRDMFFLSSSLAPAEDNLNTIYLYNIVRGRLRNIPSIGTNNPIYVSIFSGSDDNSEPTSSAEILTTTTTYVNSHSPLVVTGGYVSTGVYSASFAYTGSSTLTKLYDVWWTGSAEFTSANGATHFHTGAIYVSNFSANVYNPSERYVLSLSNLRESYGPNETARFKLYARPRDWAPTIHTKAVNKPETTIITSASYEVFRASDGLRVIPFGTGSDYHTGLSYNVSGNYFDLDMSNLEQGQMYGIRFAFYDDSVSSWNTQQYEFKFKVRNNEY